MDIGHTVGNLFQVTGDMAAQQDAVVLVLNEIQKHIQNLAAHYRVQTAGSFVQNQQPGMVRQRGSQTQLHPHSTAEILDHFSFCQLKTTAQAFKS